MQEYEDDWAPNEELPLDQQNEELDARIDLLYTKLEFYEYLIVTEARLHRTSLSAAVEEVPQHLSHGLLINNRWYLPASW